MKSDKKFTVSDRNSNRRLLSETKSNIPVEENKESSTLTSLKQFFNEYNRLFSKPTSSFGDADSYFKYTLRNQKDFNLFKNLSVNERLLKSARSTDNLHQKTPQKPRFLLSARSNRSHHSDHRSESKLGLKRNLSKPKTSRKEPLPDLTGEPESEPEVEVFFSPKNELFSEDSKSVKDLERPPEYPEKQTVELNSLVSEEKEDTSEEEATEQLKEDSPAAEDTSKPVITMADEEEVVTADEMEGTEGEITDAEAVGDEMEEVEAMIKQASQELEQVAEENQQLLDALGEDKAKEDGDEEDGDDDGDSIFEFDPKVDSAVLRELEDCERQAKDTAAVITKIKNRVAELMQKEKMSEPEAKELEAMNKELKAQMTIFEEKTKRIQQLITQANLFDSYKSPLPALPVQHDEDKLPKVIVCGMTENNMPKIILCSDKKNITKNLPPGTTQKLVIPCTAAKGQMRSSFANQGMPPNMMMPPQNMMMPQQNMMRPQQNMMMPQQNMMMPQQNMMPPQNMMPQQNMMPPNMQPPPMNGMPHSPRLSVMPQLAQTLNESFCMQEKLAAENQNLEGMRYKLQSDLATKDSTVECLQRQLDSLKTEMRMICKENSLLTEKLMGKGDTSCGSSTNSSPKKMGCEKGNRGSIETRLKQYSDTTENLEKQLVCMEKDVRNMQSELCSVQKERQHLEHHRKQLAPCPPPHVCSPPPQKTGSQNQQLCELKEQYRCLQDDFKSKLCEVAGLRADNEKFKSCIGKLEEDKKKAEEKVRELESEMKKLVGHSSGTPKENLIELEQELKVARQRFREAQDELEELRALIEDQQSQLDDYRNKYIVAQQEVEEQRRQIDMMEMENNRISEQVNLEIQRVKNQFQEKLQELTPLPEVLKCTQVKLQEAQQMHMLAERNNEAMARELQLYKDKIAEITKELNDLKGDDTSGEMTNVIDRLNKTITDLTADLATCKMELAKMKELAEEKEKLAQEKLHEIAQLQAQLESVREESARQVARTKDRCETVRRSMQNQISELERQLAQSRAAARTAQKDRDDIRQKMQAQINNLNENFEDAQMRIRNLQGHVNFLKTSYNAVFTMNESKDDIDPCNCGMDK